MSSTQESLYCPRCGSEAEVLLELSCRTTTCQNYDADWDKRWITANKPNFTHSPIPGSDQKYLGIFVIEKHSFDLYSFKNIANQPVIIARYGNDRNDAYYIDDSETEIGNVGTGPTTTVPSAVVAALQEALRRHRRRRK